MIELISKPLMTSQWDVPPSCVQCHQITDCATIHNDTVPNCLFEICQACTELAELNKKIAAVHEQLASLVLQRRAVKSRCNLRHDQLTSRLPMEIICEIFVLVIDGSSYDICNPKDSICPPLLLGIVCKRWRDITLALPRLWSTLTLSRWGSNSSFPLLEKWLHRSSTTPLNVTYLGDRRLDATCYHPVQHLRNILRAHATRWNCFYFSGRWGEFYRLFNNLDDISQLDTLSISISAWEAGEYWEPRIQMKEPVAPRNLTIRGVSPDCIPFQWTNLTYLNAGYLELLDFLHIIRHANRLTSFVVQGILSDLENTSHSLPTTPIVHPLITTVENHYESSIVPFRYLTFPSLKTFNHTYLNAEPWAIDTLVDFLDRSGAGLDTCSLLNFSLAWPGPDVPTKWWKRLSWITHLRIFIDEIDTPPFYAAEFFCALAETLASGPEVLPHLQDLCIDVSGTVGAIWPPFCDVLRALTGRVGNLNEGIEPSKNLALVVGAEQILRTQLSHTVGHDTRPLRLVHIKQVVSPPMQWYRPLIEVDILAMILDIKITSGFQLELLNCDGDIIIPASRLLVNRELPFSSNYELLDYPYQAMQYE